MKRNCFSILKFCIYFLWFCTGIVVFIYYSILLLNTNNSASNVNLAEKSISFSNDGVRQTDNFWWKKSKRDPYKEFQQIISRAPIEPVTDVISDMTYREKISKVDVPPSIAEKIVEEEGPGYMGKPVSIREASLSVEQRKLFKAGWKNHAFNEYASNLISIHRRLPDYRSRRCRTNLKAGAQLPNTSIIICFHNEAWSTLLRTVHSVLDRSPSHLVHEVILVDDASTKSYLQEPLDDYVKRFPKLKIVRNKKREGLIRSRLIGTEIARGVVLTFLDSHIEATTGWLEPLLDRIATNWSNVAVPVIDVIDDNTLELHIAQPSDLQIGGFDWNLQFIWHSISEPISNQRKHLTDPVKTPTMAGGLFSISKKYFQHLGMYDPGFEIWGGENLELSFKIWMCGGNLEIIPCSHVGHIFRKFSPYSWGSGNVLRKNSVRLAEVWLDDYKKFYYERFNYELGDFGDVSDRKKLRQSLHCKTFKWYLDTIYPEFFVPMQAIKRGDIRNVAVGICLDGNTENLGEDKLGKIIAYVCHNQGGNQFWMMSKRGEIRRDDFCFDFTGSGSINLFTCHGGQGNQNWEMTQTNQIRHKLHDRCIELSSDSSSLLMNECSSDSDQQRWQWRDTK